uniref:Uncharacterized protein n=1 Tax=Anguilla anguilla TaxID=7936 RepID=A0A0E9XTW4_ANGAN
MAKGIETQACRKHGHHSFTFCFNCISAKETNKLMISIFY